MTELTVTVQNETGLHARPAAAFTKFCSQFDNDITLLKDTTSINPKSILQVLAAGLAKGTELKVQVAGEDALNVATQVVEYIQSLKE